MDALLWALIGTHDTGQCVNWELSGKKNSPGYDSRTSDALEAHLIVHTGLGSTIEAIRCQMSACVIGT